MIYREPSRMTTKMNLSHPEKSLIFRDANLRHGFTQIPNSVLRDPRLSAAAVRLYVLLLSYAWQDDECFLGQDTLAGDMGCNRRTTLRALAELRKFNLISWDRRGLGKTNIYYIERLSDGYVPVMLIDKGGME